MNTRYDNHAPFAHGHRSHPISLLSEAVASADKTLIDQLVLREDISRHAYHKWDAAGRPDGDGVHFWLEAERELADRAPLENQAAQKGGEAERQDEDKRGRDTSQDADRHSGIRHVHSLKL
jgi:hypothetical protein